MNLGYACINLTLGNKITTNRSMIKATFIQRGIPYAAELCLANVLDLEKIMHWNAENNIHLFRMSPVLFPWASEYSIDNLPNIESISEVLIRIGNFAKENSIRITVHPAPYNVLCSPHEKVIVDTITDLEIQGKIFDLMGLERSPFNKINIHCNGVYGNKKEAMQRFCDNFHGLSLSVRKRLSCENDDKKSMYTIQDLMYIHEQIGIPLVFDYHHHMLHNDGITQKETLELAMSTWDVNIKPVVHYSSSKQKETGNPKDKPQSHSDYVLEEINTYSYDLDVMLECKSKDLALLKYRESLENKDVIQNIST